jgi:hypothetical protein
VWIEVTFQRVFGFFEAILGAFILKVSKNFNKAPPIFKNDSDRVLKKLRILSWFQNCWEMCRNLHAKKLWDNQKLRLSLMKVKKLCIYFTALAINVLCDFLQHFNNFEISRKNICFLIFRHFMTFWKLCSFYKYDWESNCAADIVKLL